MAYRDDVTALSARHDALAAEVAHKTRELEESRRLLEQARTRARLPVLDHIRVAIPQAELSHPITGVMGALEPPPPAPERLAPAPEQPLPKMGGLSPSRNHDLEPSQPAARPTKHVPATAGKRAR